MWQVWNAYAWPSVEILLHGLLPGIEGMLGRRRAGGSVRGGCGVRENVGVLHRVGVLRHKHHAPALWLCSEV